MGSQVAMDIDLLTEVVRTEEIVDALLEYLVGPLLPLKHCDIASETPSEAQQKSVAKQVHAAAVLYNYIHLIHHRESEFLKFDQFCNMAIMFKPTLFHHMKYTCQFDRPSLDDPESQLSLTEKAIMDACIMSETLLNGSDNISNVIKEWSITKVAVMLLDSKMENCFLKLNDGVWSVIEKDLYAESEERKKKIVNHDEEGKAGLEELAFLAVKEATGYENGELKVLESHVVYSLSQAKTSTLLFIVQSSQSVSGYDLVPIQDVICSLQGPVVKQSLGSWVVTPVVKYYYLLPYAEIISKLLLRDKVSNSSPHLVEMRSADANIFQGSQKPCETESDKYMNFSGDLQMKSKLDLESVHVSNSSKEDPRDSISTENLVKSNNTSNDFVSSLLIDGPLDHEVKENKDSSEKCIMDASSDTSKKNMNATCRDESNISSSRTNDKNIDSPLKEVCRHEKKSTPTNSISSKENLNDLNKKSTVSQSPDEMIDSGKNSCMVSPNVDRTLAVCHAREDFHSAADAKSLEISEAALRALYNKRQKLCHQQEVIESELTLCDNKIQKIMDCGMEDCMDLKIEALIDCCNQICKQDGMQTQENTNLHIAKSSPLVSGKSLSGAQITLRKPCQELNDLGPSKNWIVPTNHTSHLDGGVEANVTVKRTSDEYMGSQVRLESGI